MYVGRYNRQELEVFWLPGAHLGRCCAEVVLVLHV